MTHRNKFHVHDEHQGEIIYFRCSPPVPAIPQLSKLQQEFIIYNIA
jgi:hypothetical protein